MERIIHEASSLASRLGTEHLDQVAEKLGMAVFYLLDAEDLKEAYFPELQAVALRPGLPGYERRYLLAHALGHHLFHQQTPGVDYLRFHSRTLGTPSEAEQAKIAEVESEADLFAAYLLVPHEKLTPYLEQQEIWKDADPAQSLALEFRLPVEAMRILLVYERCLRLKNRE